MTSIFPKTEPLLASSRITLKGIEVIEIFDSDEEAPPSSSRISTRSDRKGVATRSTQTHPFPSNAFSSTLTSPYTHKHGYAHRASTSRKSDPTNTASRRKRLQEAEEAKSHHKRTKSLVLGSKRRLVSRHLKVSVNEFRWTTTSPAYASNIGIHPTPRRRHPNPRSPSFTPSDLISLNTKSKTCTWNAQVRSTLRLLSLAPSQHHLSTFLCDLRNPFVRS